MSSELLTNNKTNIILNLIQCENLKFNGFIGNKYINQNTLLNLECNLHGEWASTSFKSFVKLGTRCPYCAGVGKYTEESASKIINSKLSKLNTTLKFIGFKNWTNKNPKNNKCIFICENNHIWDTCSITDFVNKLNSSCGKCTGGVKLDETEEYLNIQKILLEIKSDIVLQGFEKWNGCNTKIIFICPKHGKWNTTTINSFKNQKSGCPKCSIYGYNNKKAGSFYIQELFHNNEIYYKFGITNLSVIERVEQQKRNSIFNHKIIYEQKFIDGSIPQLIENEIKSLLKCGVIDKSMLLNGYTETINKDDFENLFNIVEKFKEIK